MSEVLNNKAAETTANVTANLISDTKVATGEVRLCYPHLFEPWASSPDQKPKYTVCIQIDKSDTATMDAVNKAIEGAIAKGREKFGPGFKGPKVAIPVHDGDVEKEDNADFAGKYYMNCSNIRRPQVVDTDFDLITDEDEIYGGVYGRVSVDFFPYSVSGHSGISASLGNVQKLRDAEALGGGRSTARSDFGGGSDSFFA